MNDHTETLRTLGLNGTVLGVTWLSDIELMLKIILLILSISYTVIKLYSHFKEKK
jgi:hypothetical protein